MTAVANLNIYTLVGLIPRSWYGGYTTLQEF